eukprot:scaffold8030_cov417-Prasinococcus_capsulatus_cf.AAC.7
MSCKPDAALNQRRTGGVQIDGRACDGRAGRWLRPTPLAATYRRRSEWAPGWLAWRTVAARYLVLTRTLVRRAPITAGRVDRPQSGTRAGRDAQHIVRDEKAATPARCGMYRGRRRSARIPL